jgi:nucleoside-diphosphate-sugar epimerase
MHVLTIGGAGQLGHFILKHLASEACEQSIIGMGRLPEEGYLPGGTHYIECNVEKASEKELQKHFKGVNTVIHAAGADGRNMFPSPAIKGFREANVNPIPRIISAMRAAGANRLIILGSYYTAMHRMYPNLDLPGKSAYIQSRVEQTQVAFEHAAADIDVAILELPYIFGAAPGRGTLWGFYVDSLKNCSDSLAVHAGGSACITMNQVGVAAAHAALYSKGHKCYPIGNSNFTYVEIYQYFAKVLDTTCDIVPQKSDYFKEKAMQTLKRLEASGVESAYDPIGLLDIEEQLLYIDPLPSMQALNYHPEAIDAAIQETVEATIRYAGRGPGSLTNGNKAN